METGPHIEEALAQEERLCHMAGTAPRDRLTIQSARRTQRPRVMSGLTPNAFGNEPTGLQDVLAFIADFEMEDSSTSANHDSDGWMEEETSTSGKVPGSSLEELFVDDGRRPSPTITVASNNVLGLNEVLASTNTLESSTAAAPRRHRVTRKEKLEYLREKVTQMEDQLQQLKVRAEAAMQLKQSIALWKKMAERQKSQRDLVESENTKLREKLKTQVRMAKSLQRILRKRERAAEQITGEIPKRLKHLASGQAVATGGEFNPLVQSLDALYALTNERVSACPVATGSRPVVREQDVKYNDFSGMFLEFVNSKLVPFDVNAVSRATWRHMSEPGMKFNAYFEESAETMDNSILRRFGVEITQDERIAKMGGRQAIRRYVESDRIVIVRSSIIDRVELVGTNAGGITFRDVGWIVLKDVTGQISASGPMTLIQSYATLTPDVDLDAQWEVGALTDFALHSREDMEVGNEMEMEVALLQDSVDFDELLTFVGGSDLEVVHEASTPSDTTDIAWLDGLDELFRETSPSFLEPSAIEKTPLNRAGASKEHFPAQQRKLQTLTVAAVTKSTKRSGAPRVSRKEELEYLRLKVKEMENKLHELKENSDSDRASPPLDTTTTEGQQNCIQTEHSIALWKTMAERQKNQRELVEVENAKLREKLKTQVRMAKSLKRILCKRTRDEDQMLDIPKRTRPLQHDANSTASLYEGMLSYLDELYTKTDKQIAQSPKATLANPVIRKQNVKYSDATGMFLEFQDTKLWPFDINTVSRAMWRFLTETGHKFNKYTEEHVEMRGNTMLRKFGVEINHGTSVAVLFGRQVTRQYVESDRVVLVRHSIIDEIQLPGAPTGGLTFCESGWIVLKRAPVEFSSGSATLTQAYSTISPDIDLNAQWEVGTLTDFVLQSREDVETGNDAILESLLLEEETAKHSR
ncbi:hypothetical protein P3T76_010489 [Phytophthora citrophthora]|uniref:M96 mating-specific protein family n=1 Tax=Phytophthora citrophthora TaxID=4793 RepID=A0AAD9LGM3_9STRA|nr:hypothetical protein P3T76_010489 [Phytophthora citrophthora]